MNSRRPPERESRRPASERRSRSRDARPVAASAPQSNPEKTGAPSKPAPDSKPLSAKPLLVNPAPVASAADDDGKMIELFLNDRLGRKVRVFCNTNDTVGELKLLVAAQTGTRPEKLRIQKWYTVWKDHIMLQDYEVKNGMSLELYYS